MSPSILYTVPELVQNLFKLYETKASERPHLGASEIGDKCARKLWYKFRWVYHTDIPARIQRIFETGKRYEERLLVELKRAGYQIREYDEETGKQFTVESVDGHFGGSTDGLICGIEGMHGLWFVLELKTFNDKRFQALQNEGVRRSNRQHYDQTQVYMRLTGIPRAVYIAVNKNDDSLYAEIIEFSDKESAALIDKAEAIVHAQTPPDRIVTNTNWPPSGHCQWCNFNAQCFFPTTETAIKTIQMSCRTCAHSKPGPDKTWLCNKHNKALNLDEQKAGCPDHIYISGLIASGRDVVEISDEKVVYKFDTGETLTNSKGGTIARTP